MTDDTIQLRQQEYEQVYNHLFAIRQIVAHKSLRSGTDKEMADLFINGFEQFSFKYGLKTFSWDTFNDSVLQEFEHKVNIVPNLLSVSEEVVHQENRDIVRHLLEIRNIRNIKCNRCEAFGYCCQGCCLSGHEYFNICSGLQLIEKYDIDAISMVLGLNYEDTKRFVITSQEPYKTKNIIMANPIYETNISLI